MNLKQIAIAFAAVAFLPFVPYAAKAATFLPINKGRSLVMTGRIVEGDEARLRAAWAATVQRTGYPVERIFLNSPGGHIFEADKIARLIQQYPIDTVVGRTDVCVSACVLVFAAGKKRVAFPTSSIGVHSVAATITNQYGSETKEDLEAMAVTTLLARRLARLGVPYQIIGKLVATEHNDMKWLDAYDAALWNLEVLQ